MEIHLTDDEAALLREVLDRTLRDLNYEIADTDRSDYREGLRERREHLTKILATVGGPLESAG